MLTGYDIKEAAKILAEALIQAARIEAEGRKVAAEITNSGRYSA